MAADMTPIYGPVAGNPGDDDSRYAGYVDHMMCLYGCVIT